MPAADLRDAIAANLGWLRSIRLVHPAEYVWLALPAALAVCVLLVTLTATPAGALDSLTGAVAHWSFVVCVYFAAARAWIWRLALIVCLSEINLLIYIWCGGPDIAVVLRVYGVLALVAMFASLLLLRRASSRCARLSALSNKKDFRWLVTAAPIWLRRRAHRIVRHLQDASGAA